MDFRKLASRETSETVGRLVSTASEKVTSDLQALHQAFDMVTGALDAALKGQSNPDYGDEVEALAERLAAEADKYVETATEQARKEAEAVADRLRADLKAQSAENADLKASLKEVRTEAEGLRADLKAQREVIEGARAEAAKAREAAKRAEAVRAEAQAGLDKTRRDVESARRDIEAGKEELRSVHQQLEASRAEAVRVSAQRDAESAQNEKVTAALSTVTTELQDAKAQVRRLIAEAKTAETELAAVRRAGDDHERTNRALQAKLKEATATIATLEERAKTADAQAARVRTEADAVAKASAQAKRAVEEAESRAGRQLAEQGDSLRKKAGTFVTASLDRLLAMYLKVAKGATADDVLVAVVDALAAQFSRVALFRVQSNRLEGVRQVGFEVQDISQVLIPRTRDSLITQAVTSGNIETSSGPELAGGSGMPFGGTPEFGLALPLAVDGQCVAVVYADDFNQADREFAQGDVREKFARLLQCQAVPLLTRLAAEAKVVAELDQYAALLLKELEQTHAAEVSVATPDAERRKSLKDNIEYARQAFAQRAAAEGPRAAALFDRRLFAAVETQADTPFGRDILAVVGGRKRVARGA